MARPRRHRLAAAIALLIAGPSIAGAAPLGGLDRADLRILAERHFERGSGTFVVYADGTGIYDRRAQFRVSPSGLDRLIDALEAARFGEMPATFGFGKKWLLRRVSVTSGTFRKDVVQIRDGERSEALRELTDRLFGIVSPLVRESTTATDLGDGLRKVAAGDLAPQCLRLVAHAKPRAGGTAPGFLVKIEDGRGTRQDYRDGAYTEARDLGLTPERIRALAGVLAAADPATLPANVHKEDYTELVVQVLDQRKAVLARRFSGRAPAAHVEARERLDRLVARLRPALERPGAE